MPEISRPTPSVFELYEANICAAEEVGYADTQMTTTLRERDRQLRLGSVSVASRDWRKQAACRDLPPEFTFPKNAPEFEEARKICAGCPVTEECLDDDLRRSPSPGIRSGKDQKERQAIKRDRKLARASLA